MSCHREELKCVGFFLFQYLIIKSTMNLLDTINNYQNNMKIAIPIKLILVFSLLQIHTFVAKSVYSIGSNITISTLTFTPRPKDNGRLLACQAKINDLPESGLDSKRKLVVYCKYNYHIESNCCERIKS